MRLAGVMNAERFGIPADPPDLDVDQPTAAQRERVGGGSGMDDRLVEADVGPDRTLQRRVIDHVVVRERLFHHQQVERIELSQVLGVGEGICRVGIHREQPLRIGLADGTNDIDVPPRLDLEFDAPVALGDMRQHLSTSVGTSFSMPRLTPTGTRSRVPPMASGSTGCGSGRPGP